MRRWLALAALACAGCGHPQQLPVAIPRCDAITTRSGSRITAVIENRSTKPISGVDLAVDFYYDFRYTRVAATAILAKALDPEMRRAVTFAAAARQGTGGQAMRCLATRIQYLDGTSESLTPAR